MINVETIQTEVYLIEIQFGIKFFTLLIPKKKDV